MKNEQAYRYLKRVYLSTKNDSYREALSVAMSCLARQKSENSIESLISRAEAALKEREKDES